jgi:argininosuccinate lyase
MSGGSNQKSADSPASPPSSQNKPQHRMWGGAFGASTAPEMDALNRSIGTDFRLWPHDIRLSKAWATELGRAGVISDDESRQLVAGLDAVANRIAAGVEPDQSDEDIHTLIDRILHEEAGAVASRLHTGRSRNDQVATATRLWLAEAAVNLDEAIRNLQQVMLDQAEALEDALMPAYTHMQRAQPVAAAHWMLSHFWPLDRDRTRLASAAQLASVLPLGAGAVAGCAFPINRENLRSSLGFASISENSIDVVGDRDFVADLLYAITMTGVHLSRLAEDLILFATSEFKFVTLGHTYSTGSSMMPQKRNPDALEIARGVPGRLHGDLTALLMTLKGMPASYSKDLQDDKRALFDAVDTMLLVLPAVAGTLAELKFNRDRMSAAISGTMMATDLADYLVRKGVTFREAHGAVGRIVKQAEERGVDLQDLSPEDFRAAHLQFGTDVAAALSPKTSVGQRDVHGGTGPSAMRAQFAAARASLRRND